MSKRTNNLLKIPRIKFEQFLDDNPIVVEILFTNNTKIKGNCYDLQISADKVFVLQKEGRIFSKLIIPFKNVLAIKKYYIDIQKQQDIKKEDIINLEDNDKKSKGTYLPSIEERMKIKQQFLEDAKRMSKDFVDTEKEVSYENKEADEKKMEKNNIKTQIRGADLLKK